MPRLYQDNAVRLVNLIAQSGLREAPILRACCLLNSPSGDGLHEAQTQGADARPPPYDDDCVVDTWTGNAVDAEDLPRRAGTYPDGCQADHQPGVHKRLKVSARALTGLNLQEQGSEPAGQAVRVSWLSARALTFAGVTRWPAAGWTDRCCRHSLAHIECGHRAPP